MRKQHGFTIMGFLTVVILVALAAIVTMKVIPTYVEYFKIKKSLISSMTDAEGGSLADIRKAFEKRQGIEDIQSVTPQDIQVTRDGAVMVARLSYRAQVPLVYNVSLVFDFEVEARK